MRGEEHERSSVQRPSDVLDQPCRLFDEPIFAGELDVDWEQQERLALMVEWRTDRERLGCDLADAEPIEGKVE